MARITSHRESAERYTVLRFLGVLFTVLGSLLLAGGFLLLASGLYAMLAGSAGQPPRGEVPFAAPPVVALNLAGALGGVVSTLWAFGLLVSGLQFLATGALFRLVIHVEENTRISAQCLEQMRSRAEPIGQDVGPIFRS
jgi:hypothetical protein